MPGDQQGVHRQKHKVRRCVKVFFIFSAVTRFDATFAISRRRCHRPSIGPSVARVRDSRAL